MLRLIKQNKVLFGREETKMDVSECDSGSESKGTKQA